VSYYATEDLTDEGCNGKQSLFLYSRVGLGIY